MTGLVADREMIDSDSDLSGDPRDVPLRRPRDFQLIESIDDAPEHDGDLTASKIGTKAEMRSSCAEGDVIIGQAADVETIRECPRCLRSREGGAGELRRRRSHTRRDQRCDQ